MPRHNLYNKKTPKSYFFLCYLEVFQLLHHFKPLWLILKFEHEFRVWHPRHHDCAFAACLGLLRCQFLGYNSPHFTPQLALDLEKEKNLITNTKISIFCINSSVYTWVTVFCVMLAAPFKDRDLGWQYQG
jgi:hypothetical protein